MASETIHTSVSEDLKKDFDKINLLLNDDEKITFADCIRRGFYNIKAEKLNLPVDQVLNRIDIVPLQVRDRIRRLGEKVEDLAEEINTLKRQSGIL